MTLLLGATMFLPPNTLEQHVGFSTVVQATFCLEKTSKNKKTWKPQLPHILQEVFQVISLLSAVYNERVY